MSNIETGDVLGMTEPQAIEWASTVPVEQLCVIVGAMDRDNMRSYEVAAAKVIARKVLTLLRGE